MAADKASVIADYRAAYAEFRAALDGLSDEQLERPFMDQWGLREVAAHIAGWHDQMATGLERMARGERPTPEGVDWSDVQVWNDRFAVQVNNRRAGDLLRLLDDQTRRFIAAMEALPEDRYGENKTANRIAANAGYEHFREHAEDIHQARAAGTL